MNSVTKYKILTIRNTYSLLSKYYNFITLLLIYLNVEIKSVNRIKFFNLIKTNFINFTNTKVVLKKFVNINLIKPM